MLPRLLLRGRNFVSACLIRLDVRFWHLADMLFTLANVCFWVESGHGSRMTKCPLMTQSGHCLTAEAEAKRPDDRLIELVVGSSVIGNDLEAVR